MFPCNTKVSLLSENLGCYPKIAKFGAIFPLKRQYKNLVGLTKIITQYGHSIKMN
jgi:hypothetical protein